MTIAVPLTLPTPGMLCALLCEWVASSAANRLCALSALSSGCLLHDGLARQLTPPPHAAIFLSMSVGRVRTCRRTAQWWRAKALEFALRHKHTVMSLFL